jgi:hypothetical protein
MRSSAPSRTLTSHCRGRGLLLAATLLLVPAGCGDGPLEPDELRILESSDPQETSVLQVRIATTGTPADGYVLRVHGTERPVQPFDTVTVPRLPAGPVDVELVVPGAACVVAGENPRSVSLPSRSLETTRFDVSCDGVEGPPAEGLLGPGGGAIGTPLPGGGSAILSFPAGALTEPVVVRITPLEPEGSERARVRIEPAGLILAEPAVLHFRFGEVPGSNLFVHVRGGRTSFAVPTVRDAETVTAELPFLGFPASPMTAPMVFAAFSPGVAFSPADTPPEEAGVVTVEETSAVLVAERLVRYLESAPALSSSVRSLLITKLMLTVTTQDPAGLAEATVIICEGANAARARLETTPVASPGDLAPLVIEALTWAALFLTVDEVTCPGFDGEAIVEIARGRFLELIDALRDQLLGPEADRTFADILTRDIKALNDLDVTVTEAFGVESPGAREVSARIDALRQDLVIRLLEIGRENCVAGWGYEALAALAADLDLLGLLDLGERLAREIQHCGTSFDWSVLGEEDEVRATGEVRPPDAASVTAFQDFQLRYGDRLVLTGRMDALRCEAVEPTSSDRLEVRAAGALAASFEQVGIGPSATLLPDPGRSVDVNDMVTAFGGALAEYQRFLLRVRRESTACDERLNFGLPSSFAFLVGSVQIFPLEVVTDGIPQGRVDQVYEHVMGFENGQAAASWRVVGGSPPPGLSLSEGGVLSGTPEAEGTFEFTVELTSGGVSREAALSVVIGAESALAIETSALPSGRVSFEYLAFLDAAGGPEAPRTWSVAAGGLPAGLVLETIDGRGRISGVPTTEGTFDVTIRVEAGGETAGRAFQIQIEPEVQLLYVVETSTDGENWTVVAFFDSEAEAAAFIEGQQSDPDETRMFRIRAVE